MCVCVCVCVYVCVCVCVRVCEHLLTKDSWHLFSVPFQKMIGWVTFEVSLRFMFKVRPFRM